MIEFNINDRKKNKKENNGKNKVKLKKVFGFVLFIYDFIEKLSRLFQFENVEKMKNNTQKQEILNK